MSGWPKFGEPFGRRFGGAFGTGGGGATPLQTFNAYAAALAPKLWYRLDEPSGALAIINYGSLGAALNGTPSNVTLAQTGQLGVGQAASWNGTTSFVSAPNSAAIDGVAKYTWAFLCKPNSAGEANNARLYNFGSGSTYAQININKAVAAQQIATTSANSLASGVTFLTFSAWQWVFIDYDDTGDRKLHFYKGFGGVVTEAGYTTQTAATGSEGASGLVLYIGNRLANDTTWDGLFDEVLFFGGALLTADQKLQLTLLAGL